MNESGLEMTQCPGCGSRDLRPVNAGQRTNFFCADCVLCWYREHDRATGVDPQTCPGCQLGKTTCLGGYGGLHARW